MFFSLSDLRSYLQIFCRFCTVPVVAQGLQGPFPLKRFIIYLISCFFQSFASVFQLSVQRWFGFYLRQTNTQNNFVYQTLLSTS